MYTYTPISPPSCISLPSLQVVTKHQADLPVLCSYFPLAICFNILLFFLILQLLYLFIYYLFLAVLGLRFVQGLSLVAASGGHSSSRCGDRSSSRCAGGPFTIVAPPVAGHRLQTRRLSSCGSQAQLLHGMWDLPRPGLEPLSPALAGRFSTTAPPGKPQLSVLHLVVYICQCYSLTSSQLPLPLPCVLKSILYVCVFIPVLLLGSSEAFFSRFHIYVLPYGIYFSLFFLNFTFFLYSRFLLVIYFMHISVYMSTPISQFIPLPPPPQTFPPWCPYICSLHLSLFLHCKPVHLYHFSRFHIYALIYDISFSLSDLLHSG